MHPVTVGLAALLLALALDDICSALLAILLWKGGRRPP